MKIILVLMIIFSIFSLNLFPASYAFITNRKYGHDKSKFLEAHKLIHEENYIKAMKLLEQNIEEYPLSYNIDYEYGWALFCASHLKDLDRMNKYYKIIQKNYYGYLSDDKSGAILAQIF